VVSGGKPLTSGEKGSQAQGGEKPQRECGLRVQSPIQASGEVLPGKETKEDAMLEKILLISLVTKSANRRLLFLSLQGSKKASKPASKYHLRTAPSLFSCGSLFLL